MAKDARDESEMSWDTPYFHDFKNAKLDDPELFNKINVIPERTKLQRTVARDHK